MSLYFPRRPNPVRRKIREKLVLYYVVLAFLLLVASLLTAASYMFAIRGI